MIGHSLEEALRAVVRQDPILFLDYDGTLVPIIMNPEESYADSDLTSLISDLRNRFDTYIVTGRSPEEIRRFLPLNIDMICYHGACSIIRGQMIYHNGSDRFLDVFNRIYDVTKAWVSDFPGLRIYKKNLAVLYHLGLMGADMKPALRSRIEEIAKEFGVETYYGKMIIELRVPGVNKGSAIRSVRKGRPAIIAGDDATDELAFEENEDAVTIKVGDGESHANFHVKDYIEMRMVLRMLLNLCSE
ncbi:trehalose-phosphatase [Thermoplasma sp.]|uniref:trehalose-phosphatase n=1 Tax=Thermoplasma sp. TaxID=1973142 RepID=UPI001278336F|nr:trehalose-phosphatase [Thermoplasma sp.]KAA8922857.1 MAG: trehalose-phosphatase [Thermoplasma sp.]